MEEHDVRGRLTAVKQQIWKKLRKTTGNKVKENDGDGILWRTELGELQRICRVNVIKVW